MKSLSELFGHLHPVLLHFPIALLWAGTLVEIARIRWESPFTARASVWLFGLGALLATAACASGWVLAAYEPVRHDERATLEWHRWLGLATAVTACAAWAASVRWREATSSGQRWLRRAIALVTACLLTAASHLGASIVWGKDWFTFSSH